MGGFDEGSEKSCGALLQRPRFENRQSGGVESGRQIRGECCVALTRIPRFEMEGLVRGSTCWSLPLAAPGLRATLATHLRGSESAEI